MFASAVLAHGVPSAAQDPAAAGALAWRTAGCAACHGTFGEGGGGGEQPVGPSLRRTQLDRELFTETVRCGRPGTEMPYFLRGAYTEVECWGISVEPHPPTDVVGPGTLSVETIDLIVEYLFARVVGQSDTITLEECAAYFGNPDHPGCDAYR